MALLTGKAVKVVDIRFGSHHHLKSGYRLGASSTAPRSAKHPSEQISKCSVLIELVFSSPEVVSFTEDEIRFRVES